MKINIYNSYEEMSQNASEFVVTYINKNKEDLLCFAAGNSPEGTYDNMVKAYYAGKLDISKSKLVSLDEWLGIDVDNEGGCINFVNKKIIGPMDIKKENTCMFDGCAENPEAECSKIDSFIFENGRIGLMVVGVGMNGHIALNEPGTSFNLYSHAIELDEVTRNVAQKYFSKAQELTGGITLGLKHLMESRTLIVIADGQKKAEIMKRAINGEVTEALPASIIQKHPNCFVFLDKEAGSLL